MRYFRLNKTLLYRLPAEYNVENQKNIMYLLVLLHVNHYFCYLNCPTIWVLNSREILLLQSRKTRNERPAKLSTNKAACMDA